MGERYHGPLHRANNRSSPDCLPLFWLGSAPDFVKLSLKASSLCLGLRLSLLRQQRLDGLDGGAAHRQDGTHPANLGAGALASGARAGRVLARAGQPGGKCVDHGVITHQARRRDSLGGDLPVGVVSPGDRGSLNGQRLG